MKDEIRDILESLQYNDHIGTDNKRKLREYITTLQEENQELNDSIIWWNNRFNAVQRDYEDYKSRIEKAVEYVKECYTQPPNIENFMHEGEMNYLLNILNGRSDE